MLSAVNGVMVVSIFLVLHRERFGATRQPFSQPHDSCVGVFCPKNGWTKNKVTGKKQPITGIYWDRYDEDFSTSGGLKVGDWPSID